MQQEVFSIKKVSVLITNKNLNVLLKKNIILHSFFSVSQNRISHSNKKCIYLFDIFTFSTIKNIYDETMDNYCVFSDYF
ncbi:MAG: hypothetical protein DRI89_11210 [Bacteroidetes bacterium]|nr:MAG: hypothetical protein DRI89_11210 [Bacteroidota bacterium]